MILGIDPGLKGGLALLNEKGEVVSTYRMPVKKINTRTKLKVGQLNKGQYKEYKENKTQFYKKMTVVDAHVLYWMLRDDMIVSHIVFELMGAGGSQDRASGAIFNSGIQYGKLLAVLDIIEKNRGKINYQVTPQAWKSHFGIGSDKQEAIEKCQELYPSVDLVPKGCSKPHDGIAEAILMARYYYDITKA